MASQITSATLKVTVKESIILNGSEQGATNTKSITGINEVSKRILSVPTSEVQIIAFSTAVAAGTFVESNVRYIRITNKDGTNHITLVFKNEFNHEVSIKLDAGQSFIFNGDNSAGLVDTINANQLAFGFTDATCDYNNDPTVTCDASKQIIPGLRVTGGDIPSGTTVASVNTPGAVTEFELSAATTGGSKSDQTLTFTAGFGDLVDITAEADTAACDVEVFVASK